ncbi:hypothetical protein PAI11_26430 [Patulibacter medicamentivorans]|uniref:NERD domain-containing protein n=1 Tax=Patulibacter medicamentivorans TaxID=1097667 RepID=H0E741_9ACTN|nr:hypothetical protein [Patulibacter medicamentivorans]EHN10536.1 hypothetical protein PAI11_26430 [Patulibacter medicamentivorans]
MAANATIEGPQPLVVLRDRRVTATAPNVDRLVVGCAGVVILDGRGYAAQLRTHRWCPWLVAEDRRRMVGGLLRQVEAVRLTLDGLGLTDVPVRGVIDDPGTRRVPGRGRRAAARQLARLAAGPPVLDADDVRRVAWILGV